MNDPAAKRKHDARVTCEPGWSRRADRPKRPYGWDCLICGARRKGYATGEAAKTSAIKHNGGTYY